MAGGLPAKTRAAAYRLSMRSSNSTHIIVEGNSHTIELDRPEVVITAILDFVEMRQ